MPRGMPGDPDEYDRDDFLRQLIDMGRLEGPALRITKKVIAKGEEVLSAEEKSVFKRDVLDVYVITECSRMGCDILWSEMLMAHENGGMCGYCAHMDARIMDE